MKLCRFEDRSKMVDPYPWQQRSLILDNSVNSNLIMLLKKEIEKVISIRLFFLSFLSEINSKSLSKLTRGKLIYI